MSGRTLPWRTLWGLALVLGLALQLACASMQAPSGGPPDKTPPTLVDIEPDSASVGLVDCSEIRLFFSEKMNPVAAEGFLTFFPEVVFAGTKWHGRREARIRFEEPLPADTVFVVEIADGLADMHRVASRQRYRFPLATAMQFPPGEVVGHLLYNGEPLTNGVVELYAVPPDSLEYFQQRLLRRTETDSLGEFRFPWLPLPGGPYLVRAFVDGNGDLRPAETEAQRLLPGEAKLDSVALVHLGVTTLYDPNTPGRFTTTMDSVQHWPGVLLAWPMSIAEDDTGWVPVPSTAPPPGLLPAPPDSVVTWPEAGPGLVRFVFFVDADGDSLLSALPALPDDADSVAWYLEPFAVVDSLFVEPGLDATFTAPAFGDSLVPWQKVASVTEAADTTGTAAPADPPTEGN
ncbi:MAG: Ig-like domain-containing protein [bacterium]